LVLFQIQTKYRDEARPRAGLLRGREFVMKDSYSFDLDDEGLQRSYDLHRDAYIKTFERLGLDYVIVSATSGAMGGSASEEFLAKAETGEDSYVACRSCDFAANTEAVRTTAPEPSDPSAQPALQVLDTPGTPTIDTLVDRLNGMGLGREFTAADTLKNVVVKTRLPGEKAWSVLVVGVPGDREVDFKRLEAAVYPAEVALFEADDFAAHPGLAKGYIGPQVLKDLGYRYVADPRVARGTAWITGANEPDKHAAYVVAGRDFEVDDYIEAADVRAGDPCPNCGNPLFMERGIEIGHIFQLGRKYADAFELDALGPDAERIRITMGSYGIGVSRAVGAIVEQSFDDKGIIWPRAVAPADVHVVPVGKGDEQLVAAERLTEEFEAAGMRVLLDDRPLAPGVKFNDADLIGIPTIVVVGKALADGNVEIKDRKTGERSVVPLADALEVVRAAT
jgi:prolyl-tRNA synthetase